LTALAHLAAFWPALAFAPAGLLRSLLVGLLRSCWPAGPSAPLRTIAVTFVRSSAPSAANIAFSQQGYSVLRQGRENFFPHKSFEVLLGTSAGSLMGISGIIVHLWTIDPKNPKNPVFFVHIYCGHGGKSTILYLLLSYYPFSPNQKRIYPKFLGFLGLLGLCFCNLLIFSILESVKVHFTAKNFWVFWV